MRTVHLCRCGLIVMLFLAVWNVGQAQDSLGVSCVRVLDYWQSAYCTQVVGNYAYMCSGYSGLRIMDLSDPAHPVEVGRNPWAPWNYLSGTVYVKGDRAYLSYNSEGRVLDISDPTHPTEIHHWYLDSTPSIVFVHGDLAVGLWGSGGGDDVEYPCLMDISDWNNVQVTSYFPDLLFPSKPIGMAGDYLCLAGWGIEMYDISDPWNPLEVARVDTAYFGWDAKLSGDYVYLSTWCQGIRIYDVSNPMDPLYVATCDSGACGYISVSGSNLLVEKGMQDIDIWNISDPIYPIYVDTYGLPMMYPNPWFASSGDLFCSSLFWGEDKAVAVLDISDPASPVEVSQFGTTGYLGYIDIDGTTGYISDIYNGFHIVDLSDPPQAMELGRSQAISSGYISGIAVREDYAYIVDINYGLFTYSVIDPANPESLNCWQNLGQFHPGVITIVGDYAYVGPYEGPNRTWIFSLANPEAPALVDSADFAFSGKLYHGYLYYTPGREFRVVSLADPLNPQVIGSCALPFYFGGFARDIAIAGDYAYVAYNVGGVQIINISDPTNPALVGSIQGSYMWGVAASGNTLAYYQYRANYPQSMIYIMDMTDPTDPRQIGHYNIIEQISEMEIVGSYLLTVSPCKFAVYQVDALSSVQTPPATPHEFALLSCYPNPFNSTLTIPFSLPIQSEANIIIYNLLGQKVQQFAFPPLSPGAHRVMWNANSLASGVYIIRLISQGKELYQKALLLK
jgi:hypothetical protein